jgi:RNA polymerase sigma-70 factor, ECF subfamily
MSHDPDFADLMGRLRRGDPAAAEEVFRRFAGRLIALARQQLGERVRRKVDPEDVAQSALKSFFRRQAGGEYDLEDWDSLWSLLTVITLRKCGHQVRHLLAARRDIRREQALPRAEDSSATWEVIAREPTPEEAALLAEAVERLLHGLAGYQRQTVELALQGCGVPEISAQVGVSERTIYRLLGRVKRKLERLSAEDGPGG